MLSESCPSPLGSVSLQRRRFRSLFAASRPEEAGRWAQLSHVTLSQDGGLKGGWEKIIPKLVIRALVFPQALGLIINHDRSEKPKKENRLL